MSDLIAIIGTDGSGKTTVSDLVAARFRAEGLDAARVWLGSESYLMALPRTLLRLAWHRRNAKGGEGEGQRRYRAEVSRKQAIAAKNTFARRFYIALVMLDYSWQVRFKVRRNRQRDLLVADRYLFDVAVNLGLVLGWSTAQVVEFAQKRLASFPLPPVRVFLRVEPEVSWARKEDIPDLDYVRLRLSYYDAMASAFGFLIRDGSRPVSETVDAVYDHSVTQLGKPYVHYVHSNNEDVGGADKVLVLMAQHMADYFDGRTGFRSAVSLRLNSAAVTAHTAVGTPVFLHSFIRPQLSSGLRGLITLAIHGPRALVYFLRLFRRERPDIVHVNDLYDFLPALAARLCRIKVVYHLRMLKDGQPLTRLLAQLVSALADVSVSVSAAVRAAYFPSTPRHRAEVVHDLANPDLALLPVDTTSARPRPEGVPPGGRLVVMVARVEPWKGQHIFLDALTQLSDDACEAGTFVLVGGRVPGNHDYYEAIQTRAARIGAHFLGERDDVPALLLAADIFVHCATSPDPFPGVVLEGLLAGAACIGSASGGVPEMIPGKDVGVLVPPGDSAALAKAIHSLVMSPSPPRELYGRRARAQGLALCDSKRVDSEIAAIYRSLVPAGARSLNIANGLT